MTIKDFEKYLQSTNLSENTNASYLFAVKQFKNQYDAVSKKNLRTYKVWLIENFKPKTVNLRLRAINFYLEFIGKSSWKIPFVRVQQKAFLENVISEADYAYFKSSLKQDNELFWYFVIRFLAATGARVSELIQIKVGGNCILPYIYSLKLFVIFLNQRKTYKTEKPCRN